MASKNTYVDLNQNALLGIEGLDAKPFLQGQVTCHMDEVTLTECRLAARCNIKGRVMAFGRLLQLPSQADHPRYGFDLPQTLIPLLQQDLQKYALFSKVTLQNLTDKIACIGLFGKETPGLLETLFKIPPPLEINACQLIPAGDAWVMVCHVPGESYRFVLYTPIKNKAPLLETLGSYCQNAPFSTWQADDIAAKIPTIYPETRDLFLPHHLNLHHLNAIHFKKGCYLGQEIIARMHYLGKIKKEPIHLTLPKSAPLPLPGEALILPSDEEKDTTTTVVCAAKSDKGIEILAVSMIDK